jgi:peptidoglycan/LPS O-acetylase OafA/YrhL
VEFDALCSLTAETSMTEHNVTTIDHAVDELRATAFRPEIEGLRAVAVVAVLLYHAHLGPFRGGYIGVDVFFVLSGYLITRLMLSEIDRTGTVSLPRFWARRARRILPASTLVVVTTVVATRWIADPLTQGFVNRSALAASSFVANILFWTRGGYSHLALPEPLLHFWSLAVEEQFYLFWPLVLWAVARSGGRVRRVAVAVFAIIGTLSFVWCVSATPSHQSFAFYWLPTRAWELIVGSILALAGPALARCTPRTRGVLGRLAWVGLVGIIAASVTFIDPQFGFPGVLALIPVMATALVILGAGEHQQHSPGRLLGQPLMLWIGKRSYSLYLWHFPLLVLAATRWGPLGVWQRCGVLAVVVLVAAASFTLVEDPMRRNAWLSWRPHRSVLLGASLVVLGVSCAALAIVVEPSLDTGRVAASPVLVSAVHATSTTIATRATATTATTVTTASQVTAEVPSTAPATAPATTSSTTPATTPANGSYPSNPQPLDDLAAANLPILEQASINQVVPSNLRPALGVAYQDKPPIYANGCIVGDDTSTPKDCVYGDPEGAVTVVLFGDSHAAQWFSAFEAASLKHGWRLVVLTKKGCPTATIPVTNPVRAPQCGPWRDQVLARIGEIHPDLVVMSAYRYNGSDDVSWKAGLDTTLTNLRPLATRVLLLGDTPTPKVDVPSCVAGHLHDVGNCMSTRTDAIRPGRLTAEFEVAREHDADFITTYDWLCTDQWCPVVIGDVLVYRDNSHITTTAAALLTPYIDATVQSLVPATTR